jgi:hypothetical protein
MTKATGIAMVFEALQAIHPLTPGLLNFDFLFDDHSSGNTFPERAINQWTRFDCLLTTSLASLIDVDNDRDEVCRFLQ